MLSPRWRKVFRDLVGSKGRTLLIILAIAVGVFAFGSVFITQEVLLKNIDIQYRASKSSNITLYLSEFELPLLDWVRMQPGVKEVSAKADNPTKFILPGGKEEILNLTAMPDYSEMRLNLLVPIKGFWPPKKGELILERNSLPGSKSFLGDTVEIKTSDDKVHTLILSGSVYDNSAFPYIFTRQMTGFISWNTLTELGFAKRYNKLEIATNEDITTLNEVEKLSNKLIEDLGDRGIIVNANITFKPNQHWATDNSRAFTAILSVIGVFSLIMSAFLVINTTSALLAQQKKQIGIMKAIGAHHRQVTTLYLTMVAIYGMMALFIALPIGMILGYFFLKLVSDFLNLDIKVFYLPPSVLLMEIAAALFVPLIAAVIPIYQSSKKPIRVVISDYQPSVKVSRVDRILAMFSGLSRPTLISIRNVFRKRARLALTMGTLITAGALFMGVINVRSGMYKEMERILSMYDFQVSINLGKDYNYQNIESRISEVSGVTQVEARNGLSAQRIKPDLTKGGEFELTGLPPDTPFSRPAILSGRWLIPGDSNKIVLSSGFTRDNKDLVTGDIIKIEVDNKEYELEVVGVVSAISQGQSENYSDFATVARLIDKPKLASRYLVKTNPEDADTQKEVAVEIEKKLKSSDIVVTFKQTKDEIISSAANQFNFMIFFLLIMAVMVAIVGGLGLAGSMSLNVMERTREIGIMRSIGANDVTIQKLVLIEGVLVGILSWLLAVPVSVPLTYGFCFAIGNAFFERTLIFVFVPMGLFIWLIIILLISITASFLPAKRASKMSISETLSYE